jgi:hypothetical protein
MPRARNTQSGSPGGTVLLDIWFYSYTSGPLVNTDAIPTFIIYDPSDNVLATGTATHVSTGYYSTTFTIPVASILSDFYKIEWTAKINTVTVADTWEYFRVVQQGGGSFSSINITGSDLIQVKKVLGYPSLDNVVLTDDQIKELCIWPAMYRYFNKWPIKGFYSAQVGDGEITVDFPDIYTFAVMDVRLVDRGLTMGTGSSFWDIVAYQNVGGATIRGGTYGQAGYNPNGLFQMRSLQRQAIQSIQNANVTLKYFVDYPTKKVTAYTNMPGVLNITWAKLSYSFDDIRFERKFDVIKLAQSNLLFHLADHFAVITDTNMEININVEALKTRATELKQEIDDAWIQIPDISLVHIV